MEYEDSLSQPMPRAQQEPIRVPGLLQSFMERYIPCDNERNATDVLTIGELRNELSCWVPFGAKEDPLQACLQLLERNGYIITNTSSGPAMCLISKESDRYLSCVMEK